MARSIRVRPDLISQVKLAVKRNGFTRQQDLVEAVGLVSSTVRKFLNGKNVDHATFEEICQKLSLEWQDFADLREITEPHRKSEEAVIARYSTSETEKTISDTLDLAEREEVIANPHQETIERDAGSIEERIFKATNQLDPERPMFSCMSAIQALGEIAKDYPRYHWNIMEILAAFVRNNARRQAEEEGEEQRSPKLREDIQAAIRVIGGRDWNLPIQPLDLSNTDLRGANLNRANLQGANLNGTNLQEVTLIAANLQRATLKEAKLQRAIIHKAILQRANFTGANLQEADLDMTDLEKAELWNTKLQGTRLRSANLQRAKLIDVDLQGAFLWDNDWQGVVFFQVNLRGADLRRAKNLESQVIAEAFGDCMTVLPENVARPAHWI